jgi:ABC-type thiamine transport system ATPase subunit
MEVGLGYLTLNRLSNTLSGGESQRINLVSSLGKQLWSARSISSMNPALAFTRETRDGLSAC